MQPTWWSASRRVATWSPCCQYVVGSCSAWSVTCVVLVHHGQSRAVLDPSSAGAPASGQCPRRRPPGQLAPSSETWDQQRHRDPLSPDLPSRHRTAAAAAADL